MPCVIDEPSDHAGRKLTRYDAVDAMDRRLRDGQLTVKQSHRVSGNRRKDASDLDIYVERVTGIEPALSAWETASCPMTPRSASTSGLRVTSLTSMTTCTRMTVWLRRVRFVGLQCPGGCFVGSNPQPWFIDVLTSDFHHERRRKRLGSR